MGSGCIDPNFLDLGTSWWVVNFKPRPLYYRGKGPRHTSDRRLGGPQSRSGRIGEQKIFDPTRDSNSNPSVVQPVASHYTDYAILAPFLYISVLFFHLSHIVNFSYVSTPTSHVVNSHNTCLVQSLKEAIYVTDQNSEMLDLRDDRGTLSSPSAYILNIMPILKSCSVLRLIFLLLFRVIVI
jgi:hypothetical protein